MRRFSTVVALMTTMICAPAACEPRPAFAASNTAAVEREAAQRSNAPPAATAEAEDGFVPYDPSEAPSVDGKALALFAYGVILASLALYALSLYLRARRVRRETLALYNATCD